MKLSYFVKLIVVCCIVPSTLLAMNTQNRRKRKRKADQISLNQVPAKRRKLLRLLYNARNFNSNTKGQGSDIFISAAKDGDMATVEYMLAHRNDFYINSCLILMARIGNVPVTKLLLKYNAKVNRLDKKHMTALHHAADQGHLEVARVLLAHKAKVNARDEFNCIPLHYAAREGHADIVDLLLKNGAHVSMRAKVSEVFYRFKDQYNALHFAAYNNHIATIEQLLDAGANINALTQNGCSALYLAAENDHIECAQLLLKRGAQANVFELWTNTKFYSLYLLLKKLLALEVDVNAKNKEGETFLHFAAKKGDVQSVQLLLNTDNILVDEADNKGLTPLINAVKKHRSEIVQMLLATHNVNVNECDRYGCTVLNHVVMKDQDILYQLLRAGAQQLKAAWKKAYFRSDQKIIKCCYLLRIPHLWQVVRTLRQDIALGRGNVEKNKQSEHALYNTLQQKQKAFDQFMMVIALQHGWGHTIARIKNIQNHFMTSANMVLHKIKKLKHAAYAGDVQRVCKLLQTEYLLDFQLKEILNDWQVTNKVVIDIMEKRLHLQSNKTLKSKDIETIFSDYVKEQMVIQSSNSKNDLEGALLT